MKKPEPLPGLVVRYDYLWRDERDRGHIDGLKERPCAVILVHATDDTGHKFVILAAITHSPPRISIDAIEIPARVRQALGLDHDRSWIVLTEVNRARWDDPGIVPAKPTSWEYGRLPLKLWGQLRDDIVARSRNRNLKIVDRQGS